MGKCWSITESAFAKTPWTCKTIELFSHDERYIGKSSTASRVSVTCTTGAAWERTYEREIRKKETRKAAVAAVVAVADVTTACWRRGRSAHRRRGVHCGPHERQLLPSGGYPPTGG